MIIAFLCSTQCQLVLLNGNIDLSKKANSLSLSIYLLVSHFFILCQLRIHRTIVLYVGMQFVCVCEFLFSFSYFFFNFTALVLFIFLLLFFILLLISLIQNCIHFLLPTVSLIHTDTHTYRHTYNHLYTQRKIMCKLLRTRDFNTLQRETIKIEENEKMKEKYKMPNEAITKTK